MHKKEHKCQKVGSVIFVNLHKAFGAVLYAIMLDDL